MIRVLHINTESGWRGGENQLRLFLENADRNVIENHVAALENEPAIDRFGAHAKTLPLKKQFILSMASVISKYCQKNNIDVIDAQTSKAHTLGLLIKRKNPHIKLLVHRRVDNLPSKGMLSKWNIERMRVSGRANEISYNRYGKSEPHIIFGGFIIQEFTRQYLEQWGGDWRQRASFDLLYQYNYVNEPTEGPGAKKIILGSVLADEYNRGYQKLRHLIISKINDQDISSMKDVRNALKTHGIERNGKTYAKFQFIRDGGEAVIGYEGLNASHKRIAKSYQINNTESFWEVN